MSDLASELRKVIEFNHQLYQMHINDPASVGRLVGAQDEYTRLRPVLLAMVAAIEEIEELVDNDDDWIARRARAYLGSSLARLREIVGMK